MINWLIWDLQVLCLSAFCETPGFTLHEVAKLMLVSAALLTEPR